MQNHFCDVLPKLLLRHQEQVRPSDIETIVFEQSRYLREQYSELVVQKTQGPEVARLFRSIRKVVHDAILVLRTASTIVVLVAFVLLEVGKTPSSLPVF